MTDRPTCESCGAELLWVKNLKTGKRLPLLAAPRRVNSIDDVRPGQVVVSLSSRVGQVLTRADIDAYPSRILAAADGGRLRISHFATCSDRSSWQGASRGRRASVDRGGIRGRGHDQDQPPDGAESRRCADGERQ